MVPVTRAKAHSPQNENHGELRVGASYARKSDRNGDGIAVQHEINRAAAARLGYVIPDALLFSDDDTTGVSTSRAGFDHLQALVESGSPPFEVVFVRNRKRFGRWDDSGMHDYYRIRFAKLGVALRYVEGANPDYSSGMSPEVAVQAMYDRMETIDASTERTNTRRRIVTGMRRRIVRGFWPAGSVPYATQRWLADLETGRLERVVNENDGVRQKGCGFLLVWLHDGSYEAVQLMFEWVEEEQLGPIEIVRRLDELRLPPAVRPDRRSPHSRRSTGAGDATWTTAGVEYVLRKRLYCGQLLWPRGARIEDAVSHLEADLADETPILHTAFMADPPVTPERFEAVQEILRDGRRRSCPSTSAVRPLLSGLVRCAHCDAAWHGHGGGKYYRHDTRSRGACPHRNRYVRVGDLEAAVLTRALPVLEAPWFTDALAAQLASHVDALEGGEHVDELEHLKKEREATRFEIQRVIRDKARTDDPKLLSEYDAVLHSLAAQRDGLEERMAAAESRRQSVREAVATRDRIIGSARNMLSVYRTLPRERQRSILSGIIECVLVDPVKRHAEVRLKLRP